MKQGLYYLLLSLVVTLFTSINAAGPKTGTPEFLIEALSDLKKVTFGGDPIFKYKVKESTTWNTVQNQIKDFVDKNADKDKLLVASSKELSNAADSLLNTTKTLYGIFAQGEPKGLTGDQKALFEDFKSVKDKTLDVKTKLTKEFYALGGKPAAKKVLLAYAELLSTLATASYNVYLNSYQKLPLTVPATPAPTRKFQIYNNTKNPLKIDITLGDGTLSKLNLVPQGLSAEISATAKENKFLSKLTVQALSNKGATEIKGVNAQEIAALSLASCNEILAKTKEPVVTISTDGKKYLLEKGKVTTAPKGLEEAEEKRPRTLYVRNRTGQSIRINIITGAGKEIKREKPLLCSTKTDNAIYSFELGDPVRTAVGADRYVSAFYINGLPVADAEVDKLNRMLTDTIGPLYDLTVDEPKNIKLWRYFINESPL